MSEFETDLFVIGAGSGGVRAARIASGYGAKVMIAEEFRIGGTCVIRGCVPKKLYVYASRFADDFADAQAFGWRLAHKPEFDWPKLVAAKEGEISRLSRIYEANLLKAGVDVFQERAEILGPHKVRLMQSGRVVSARHILVATGAAPQMLPAIPGVEHAISSNEIFDLPEFPKRLAVVGGGYIAVEFASIFARLGAHTFFGFAKVRQYISVAPAGEAELRPIVVVVAVAPRVDHAVDHGRSTQALAARNLDAPAVQIRFGITLEIPIQVAAHHVLGERDGHVFEEPGRRPAGLQNENLHIRILAEAVGEHATRRARADDHIIEFSH